MRRDVAVHRCPAVPKAPKITPSIDPGPTRKLNTPGGKPASSRTSVNFAPHRGVRDEGLNTAVHPLMSAAPLFQEGIATGKFPGVTSATGPTGRRIVKHILSGSSDRTVWPKTRRPLPPADPNKS